MIKTALVGCGNIANVHSKVISSLESVKFCGVADNSMESAQCFAEKFHTKAYNSLEQLIESTRPDVLHITTPHYTHAPLAVYALEHGVNVLLEKPACTKPSEIILLEAAVKRSGKMLGVCLQNRYNMNVIKARELIESGMSGRILAARGNVAWNRDAAYYDSPWRGDLVTECGGALINQAVHTLDLLHYLLGEPESIDGYAANWHLKDVINVEDTVCIYLKYNDFNAIFNATTAYGTNAKIEAEIVCEKMTIQLTGSSGLKVIASDGTDITPDTEHEKSMLGKDYWGYGHEEIIKDFYSCVRDNKKFWIDITEGSKVLKTVFKLYSANNFSIY